MKTFLIRLVHYYQDTFNYPLYWKLRLRVQFMGGGVKRKLLIMYLRHIESKKCSTTGLGLMHNCCIIDGPIDLPHGLAGVVIARNVHIGSGVTIFQHVTIAESDKSKMTIIEDDVRIEAGAVILNNPHIGKGAKIGANAVVIGDVPAGSTAVGVPARIIIKKIKQ